MIMILFGALSAGTKTYLLCWSDRQAFTSAFCNTLPVGCLKFCFSLEIRSSIWPSTISFQDDRTESSTISRLVHCNAYWSTASHKSDKLSGQMVKSLGKSVINMYSMGACSALGITNQEALSEETSETGGQRKLEASKPILWNWRFYSSGSNRWSWLLHLSNQERRATK